MCVYVGKGSEKDYKGPKEILEILLHFLTYISIEKSLSEVKDKTRNKSLIFPWLG